MSKDRRSPVRALVFLIVSVATSTVALVGLYQLVTGYERLLEDARRPDGAVMVVVAARDLHQGVQVTEEDLYAVQMPAKYLPEGVYLSPESVVGRIPRERILANELVRGARLADPESGTGLNAVIPRGLRAISIDVTDGAALSGFLRPSSFVDVLMTHQSDKGEPVRTDTVLQALYVLGVNGQADRPRGPKGRPRAQRSSVTLLVTPDQAEKIAFAENTGKLVLSLRAADDVDLAEVYGADVAGLLGHQEETEVVVDPAPPRRTCFEVDVIHGEHKVVEYVDESGNPCTP